MCFCLCTLEARDKIQDIYGIFPLSGIFNRWNLEHSKLSQIGQLLCITLKHPKQDFFGWEIKQWSPVMFLSQAVVERKLVLLLLGIPPAPFFGISEQLPLLWSTVVNQWKNLICCLSSTSSETSNVFVSSKWITFDNLGS